MSYDLFDHMPIGVFILKKDFSVVFWNNILEGWTKISRDEIVGGNIFSYFPNLNQDKYVHRIADVFNGAPSTIFSSLLHKHVIPIERKNGIYRTQHTTVTPIPAKDGHVYALFSIEDVTDLSDRIQGVKNMRDQIQKEIEARKKAEKQLLLAASVFDISSEGIFIVAADSVIQSVNKAFSEITGYSSSEAVGNKPSILKSGFHGTEFYKQMWADLIKHEKWEGVIRNKRKNSEIYPQETSILAIKDDQCSITHYACVFRDITEREQHEEKLSKLSRTDGLTGIYNRRTFDESLSKEWSRGQREGLCLSLIMLDIDFFKPYNDFYGHQQGDACLRKVANTLTQTARRANDVVARYGGEEFGIILPATSEDNAVIVAERIRKNVESLKVPHERSKSGDIVTISIGLAALIPSRDKPDAILVEWADKALYKAKQAGRNKVVVFKDD